MIYINKLHIDTVQAVNLMMKFPERHMQFYRAIADNYAKNPGDMAMALAYGFFKYFEITRIVESEDLINTDILKVVEVYDRILESTPNDWFIYMLKILLYNKLPKSMKSEKDKITTLNRMLQIQQESSRKEPYFILPYIFYAEYWYGQNDQTGALEYLHEGLKEVPTGVISYPALNPHLFYPIKEFYYRLYNSEEFEFAIAIKKVSSVYFPSESEKLYKVEQLKISEMQITGKEK